MATNQTIVTTLMADPRGLQRGFTDAEKSAERFGGKMWALDRQMQARSASMANGLTGRGGGRSSLAGGFLELSRGVEDASVGFQLNGLQGAVRGAGNNLSQLAFIMGGPVTAAIAGLTIAALPMLVNWLTKTEDKTKDAEKRLEALRATLERVGDQAAKQVRFDGMLADLPDSKGLESQIKERERTLKELEARSKAFEDERRTLERAGTEKALEDIVRRESEVRQAQNKLIEDRVRLEREINVLISKRTELQEQDEFSKKFDEAESKARKGESDLQQLESMLQGRIQQLGGDKEDPLGDMNVPRHLRGPLSRAFADMDAAGKPRAQFAQVATADSQSLLRAQHLAREAAERKKEAAKTIKILEDLLREVREAKRGIQNEDEDDVEVNLN